MEKDDSIFKDKIAKGEEHFLAGSFLAMANMDNLTDIGSHVYLLIKGKTEEDCFAAYMQMRNQEVGPRMYVELMKNCRPWPKDAVWFDHQLIQKNSKLDKIIGPDDLKE